MATKESKDARLSKHLILLSIRHDEANTPKEKRECEVRYTEARTVASMLGYGVTEFEVWADVDAAIKATPGSWKGKLGAVVDRDWWEAAGAALIAKWNGEEPGKSPTLFEAMGLPDVSFPNVDFH